MKATLQLNKMGHLHVWFGHVNINQISKYNFLSNNKESDMYIEDSEDIKSFLSQLNEDEINSLEEGDVIRTWNVNEEYAIA